MYCCTKESNCEAVLRSSPRNQRTNAPGDGFLHTTKRRRTALAIHINKCFRAAETGNLLHRSRAVALMTQLGISARRLSRDFLATTVSRQFVEFEGRCLDRSGGIAVALRFGAVHRGLNVALAPLPCAAGEPAVAGLSLQRTACGNADGARTSMSCPLVPRLVISPNRLPHQGIDPESSRAARSR
jgi:hypothetical protein